MKSETLTTVTEQWSSQECDGKLAVTHAELIPAQARPFTCTFPSDLIAVVYVVGATDDEQARQELAQAFPNCQYTVEPGDPTHGCAEPFYLWICGQPQQLVQTEKRNEEMLRNAAGDQQEAQVCH